MPKIESRINTRAPEFAQNALAMQAQIEDLQKQLAQTALGGSEQARQKHLSRGKLLPRERVEQLRRRWRDDAEGRAYRDWEPAPKREFGDD